MVLPNQGYEDREYTQEALQASLVGTEGRVADAGLSWDDFIHEAGQELYQRGRGSFFFGLGDDLDKKLQDQAFEASVALDKLKQEALEAGRWSGGHKLRAVELLLRFSDLSDYHELESPTARHELQRQVAAEGLARIVDKVVNDSEKKEE